MLIDGAKEEIKRAGVSTGRFSRSLSIKYETPIEGNWINLIEREREGESERENGSNAIIRMMKQILEL